MEQAIAEIKAMTKAEEDAGKMSVGGKEEDLEVLEIGGIKIG